MHVQQCRSCGADVVWARTAFNGTPIQIDLEPVDHGTFLITEEDNERWKALALPPGDERITTETTHTSHFDTCPDREHSRWRLHA